MIELDYKDLETGDFFINHIEDIFNGNQKVLVVGDIDVLDNEELDIMVNVRLGREVVGQQMKLSEIDIFNNKFYRGNEDDIRKMIVREELKK